MLFVGFVVVIGDVLIDEICDWVGVWELVGGVVLNVVVGLWCFGVFMILIVMVGEDEVGVYICEYLLDYGVWLIVSVVFFGFLWVIVQCGVDGELQYVFNEVVQRCSIWYLDEVCQVIVDVGFVVISCFFFDVLVEVEVLIDVLVEVWVVVDFNFCIGMLSDCDEFVCGFEWFVMFVVFVKVGVDDVVIFYDGDFDVLCVWL